MDRDRLENWFQRRTTLGKARIKAVAGFYELLAEADPSRENEKTQRASGTATGRSQRSAPRTNDKPATHRAVVGVPATEPPSPNVTIGVAPSVHIDMHFHVSPESPPDQIDKIFESMARHLKLRENANGE